MSEERDPYKVNSIHETQAADAVRGRIRWSPAYSIWNGAMLAGAAFLGPLFFTLDAFLVFLGLTALTLCAGHSVGYHRLLIHRSFKCSKPTEHVLVWFGAMVGMGGPFWMIRTHDMRDWAQRQPDCHDFYSHRAGFWRDAWMNLHCRLELYHPPRFDPGETVTGDRFYRFLERTWMLQQGVLAAVLFLMGGFAWVVWGVFVRVSLSVTMHWLIGRYAHREGPQSWLVDGAGVQAHDVPVAGFVTMGEAWHNNHHAFPGSARHGHYPGQSDPGWRFIQLLERMGLVWDVQTPETLPARKGLSPAGVTLAMENIARPGA